MITFLIGQIVNTWHDTGAFGSQMVFGEIIRVNKKTITVKWESGLVKRIEPQHLELVTGKLEQEIRKEYLNKT